MILYHGSNVIVKNPKILKANRTLDFGYGFYTTTSKEQALKWAKIKSRSLPKITQENVHIFIPLKASKVSKRLAENYGISKKQALLEFYNSKTYEALEKEETKLWYEGINYLYNEIEEERNLNKNK